MPAALDFTAADVELQMLARGVTPCSVVLDWSMWLGHADRLRIRAVRIIGTCAVCGLRGPVSMCRECDLDACDEHIIERAGRYLCRACDNPKVMRAGAGVEVSA